ncbi:MAG TPA: CapA family protein, partial [Burkholderiales bacterium]|nr:CapA family protein [Burkholderiales bacterium]
MTGRGIDQILPHPSKPHLFEPYVGLATDYVELAETASGAVKKPVDFAYVWGDALEEFERADPDVRIINLETAVTGSEDAWPGKGIHYRMNPANTPCLSAAKLDCCVLANNHVLDWGRSGLFETLDSLHQVKLHTAGAGRNQDEASAPACIEVRGRGRVLVFAFAMASSGVARGWAATEKQSGVNFLRDFSERAIDAIKRQVLSQKQKGDIAVFSVHWDENWGFSVSKEERMFAHRLIDEAGIDVVHGHSSHHVKGIEVYRERPIIYGCGDFLNDYEGIGGHEAYRSDLSLMYFPVVDAATGKLLQFSVTPT